MRTARIDLDSDHLNRLMKGETVIVNVPPNVDRLQIRAMNTIDQLLSEFMNIFKQRRKV